MPLQIKSSVAFSTLTVYTMRFLPVFLVLLLVAGFARAAEEDSTHYHPPGRAKTRIIFNFDARNSIIRGEKAYLFGTKLGLEFNDRWRTGLGFYFLAPPKEYTNLPALPPGAPAGIEVPVSQRLFFNYFSVFGEYIIYGSKHWELSAPLSIGYGKITDENYSEAGNLLTTRKHHVLVLEPAVQGHYKVFSWIGIGAGIGYRHVLGTDGGLHTKYDTRTSRNFDSPVWIAKIKLFPGDILRVLRGKQSLWD